MFSAVEVPTTMSELETVIETEHLTKQFGATTAVRDLDLSVRAGETYGFLGPNGAGKTTTIHMLLSLVHPSSGRIRLFGADQDADASHRERIGVLPAHADLYDNLTACEHVELVSRLKDVSDNPVERCEQVGLGDVLETAVSDFSTGMNQRLKLAMALVGNPDLLILDEPTSGLDPNGVQLFRELIQRENKTGTTVFFSSHSLDQVERTCDRVGILDDGRLVAEDTIDDLRSRADETKTLRVEFDGGVEDAIGHVRQLDPVSAVTGDGLALEISIESNDDINRVLGDLSESEYAIQSVTTDTTSLEELFATYTNGAARKGEVRA